MKANEGPDGIYLLPDDKNPNDLSICWYEAPYRTGAIEYARKDAFIEKALKWYCLDCECNDNCKSTKCFFYRELERYLNGSEHALPPKISNSILDEDGFISDNWKYRHFTKKIQDTFIEKAFEFFGEHLWEYIDVKNANCDTFINIDGDKLKEDFKNYMKGE